ncbi:MAG: isocitrate lyase/PEP mutase family protein [Chloroflexi bacterium]|nr:isocitrate lyase/PEP mutase family protein [Chloroflexota bacterium]
MRPSTRLRQLLAQPGIIVAPGVYDALLARLVERAGFPAAYMTGSGIAATTLGRPDIGLVSFSEMAQRAGYIAEAVSIPVIADADTGYGGVHNVMRTVRAYERAGVAALHLEDQTFPKRCGHFEGKTLVPIEEATAKVRAAVQARSDHDLVIIARTDARTAVGGGLEEALRRGHAYLAAGADALFIESPLSQEELRRIGEDFKGVPLLANMVEGGKTPLLSNEELQALGYRIVIYANFLTRSLARTAVGLLEALRREGTTRGLSERMYTFGEFNALLELEGYFDLEGRLAEEARKMLLTGPGGAG